MGHSSKTNLKPTKVLQKAAFHVIVGVNVMGEEVTESVWWDKRLAEALWDSYVPWS